MRMMTKVMIWVLINMGYWIFTFSWTINPLAIYDYNLLLIHNILILSVSIMMMVMLIFSFFITASTVLSLIIDIVIINFIFFWLDFLIVCDFMARLLFNLLSAYLLLLRPFIQCFYFRLIFFILFNFLMIFSLSSFFFNKVSLFIIRCLLLLLWFRWIGWGHATVAHFY